MPPPTITRPLLNNTTSANLGLSVSTLPPAKRPRQKVVLAPGHSPLDWARLKASGSDLRVTPHLPPQTPVPKTYLSIPQSVLHSHPCILKQHFPPRATIQANFNTPLTHSKLTRRISCASPPANSSAIAVRTTRGWQSTRKCIM